MNQELTDITLILDKSGSMNSIRTDTIGGVNAFLEKQKEVPGKAYISMIQFDHGYVSTYSCRNIQEAPVLTDRTYVPQGNTALLDAIGRTIVATGERLARLEESQRPGKVLMVIITDGEENSSHEYKQDVIATMIKHQEEVYNWDFVYIGANQDAITTGKAMNFAQNNSYDFAATPRGIQDVFSTLADVTACYRGGTLAKGQFFNQSDRDKQDLSKVPTL